MKLYTVCDTKDGTYEVNKLGIRLEEYSFEDYKRFISQANKYYVLREMEWYETDMSDSDSGSIRDKSDINYANMIIKDNSLYGVIVKTRNTTPEYAILDFKSMHAQGSFGGGYSVLDYDWWLKEKSVTTLNDFSEIVNYALVYENIFYIHGKIDSYSREIRGFLEDEAVTKNGKIVGVKSALAKDHEFIFDNKSTHYYQKGPQTGNYKIVEKCRLVKLTEQYLEDAIFEVSPNDFKKGNVKILE